ncbi:uncharacterized protein LOC122653182 [Telopea speciosissima]|uniref:uncharacterized protein LOC122653182 n=1 Tax=Telopea speciosissima TaxID=54955 RepID=UPI001CC3CC57|nr:uncharacterized protein LOC122653182 [Telopea speciosissima]XP_043703060.1 uncharacterized protein LOC122653182 [Telopea speciosissima]
MVLWVFDHKMFKLDNKGDMVQKESSNDSETSSPDLRAFLNLVDRAHSLQLLKEKNQGLEKPIRNNFSAWQPSFEPEDFNLPPKRGSTSTSTVDRPRTSAAMVEGGGGSGSGGDEGKEEKRMKNGLKRPRHLVDLALHHVPEKGLKKREETSSKVLLLCDLNKEVESSEAVNGSFGLNLELGIKHL